MFRLRYAADLRTIFFITLYFSLLVATWMVLDVSSLEAFDWRLGVPLLLALAMTSFQGAVSTHNAVHCPIFKYRMMNKIWQVVLTLSYGHPVSSYVPGHNLSHHKHTQSRRDVMRTTKTRFRWHPMNLLFFTVMCVPSIMKADAQYSKAMKTRHPKWYRQLMVEIVVLWAIQIGLFVLDWRKALVIWLIPHLYAQWGIVTMNLLQHDGCDENSEYNHSRNFVGAFVNFFTFNNGYHTIHHQTPGLHWSLAPAAHAEQIAPHIHPALDQKSLLAYMFKTFVLNRRETYLGERYVPPPAGEDEPWIPDPRTTIDDLGAESLDSGHGGMNAMVAHQVKSSAASVAAPPE